MRKQTAPQTGKNRKASSRKQSGLIAQGPNAPQSARVNSVLDNRSHRTELRLSCGRLARRRKSRGRTSVPARAQTSGFH